jgi:G3E family GTPase
MRYFANRTARDPATVASEEITRLDNDWIDLERRVAVVPGKQLLSSLNTMIQQNLGISISAAQIISKLKPDMISDDLRDTLCDINEFAKQA